MAAYQLYDTGLTVTKEDKLLSLSICKYSSRIPVLRRMSGRWVTTSCPCYSLSLAVEYKNDLGSLAFWLSGFCTAIWCKLIILEKEIKGELADERL